MLNTFHISEFFFAYSGLYVSMVNLLWDIEVSLSHNVTWHSGIWPYTMTPSIDQTLHQFANLLPNWTLLPNFTLLPNCGGFHRILQRVRLTNRGRLLLRTPGPVPFRTCICSNVETILSWTCHVYGPFWISNIPRYFYFAFVYEVKPFKFLKDCH